MLLLMDFLDTLSDWLRSRAKLRAVGDSSEDDDDDPGELDDDDDEEPPEPDPA